MQSSILKGFFSKRISQSSQNLSSIGAIASFNFALKLERHFSHPKELISNSKSFKPILFKNAIAVAIRVEAPIYVTPNVLSNGSVSTDSAKDAQEAEEFKNFVQSIKPSDFARLMKDNDHHESDQ